MIYSKTLQKTFLFVAVLGFWLITAPTFAQSVSEAPSVSGVSCSNGERTLSMDNSWTYRVYDDEWLSSQIAEFNSSQTTYNGATNDNQEELDYVVFFENGEESDATSFDCSGAQGTVTNDSDNNDSDNSDSDSDSNSNTTWNTSNGWRASSITQSDLRMNDLDEEPTQMMLLTTWSNEDEDTTNGLIYRNYVNNTPDCDCDAMYDAIMRQVDARFDALEDEIDAMGQDVTISLAWVQPTDDSDDLDFTFTRPLIWNGIERVDVDADEAFDGFTLPAELPQTWAFPCSK